MSRREKQAVAKGLRWLTNVAIPERELEPQIQRMFALARGQADPRQLRHCADKLPTFTWFHYRGDPVPALVAELALEKAGHSHPSLRALKQGYQDLLADTETKGALLCDLLQIAPNPPASVNRVSSFDLLSASRDGVLEFCREVTMTTSCGSRQVEFGDGASIVPSLAFSYARDWDIAACCSLLRACCYLGLADDRQCKWTMEWALDQQHDDGRFGLLLAEAGKCGWEPDDWRLYFERTVHAVWALCEMSGTRR
jgi:hypothetical protein